MFAMKYKEEMRITFVVRRAAFNKRANVFPTTSACSRQKNWTLNQGITQHKPTTTRIFLEWSFVLTSDAFSSSVDVLLIQMTGPPIRFTITLTLINSIIWHFRQSSWPNWIELNCIVFLFLSVGCWWRASGLLLTFYNYCITWPVRLIDLFAYQNQTLRAIWALCFMRSPVEFVFMSVGNEPTEPSKHLRKAQHFRCPPCWLLYSQDPVCRRRACATLHPATVSSSHTVADTIETFRFYFQNNWTITMNETNIYLSLLTENTTYLWCFHFNQRRRWLTDDVVNK